MLDGLLAKGLSLALPSLLSNVSGISGLLGKVLAGDAPDYIVKTLQLVESVTANEQTFSLMTEFCSTNGICLETLSDKYLPMAESFLDVEVAPDTLLSGRLNTVASALLERQTPSDIRALIVCPKCGFVHATV